MRSHLLMRSRVVLAAFIVVALSAAAAIAGPPWLAIEYPVNPFDATTRDAFLVVREYHHSTQLALPITGRAEGLVDGTRRTIALRFDTTSRAGVVALRKQWPSEGTWVLVITAAQGPGDGVTALVQLARDGTVRHVSVPTHQQGQWKIPSRVTSNDVEAALREASGRAN